ncbi:hypothetical protein Btru_040316 [Bulinus truncatus]|nr:hypothetical protein Btru_040316 [Bulinus truncatus]
MDQQKSGLSFGFSKVQEVRNLSKSIINETSDVKNEKDFVLSVEGKEVNSTKPQEKKIKEYVIPLIKRNNWRGEDKDDYKDSTEVKHDVSAQNLDALAAQEILQETARYNETWSDRGTENTTLSIPLLMQNKIPEGFESEEKLDVALRPDEPDEADYEKIPIEHYGMAMLRGMGWNKNRGIGKNAKVVIPIEAHLRPKGLGLGADKSNSNTKNTLTVSETGTDNNEVLEVKKNSYCVVTNGINKDLYGTVEGLDEDNARVMVKLALTGKTINIMQSYISVVGKKEFDKYSKYLNKAKADKYKESEIKSMNNGHSNKGRDSDEKSSKHKHKKHKRESRDNSPHHKRKKYSVDEDKPSGIRGDKKNDSKKSNYTHSSSSMEEGSEPSSLRPWLRNDLKVRVIDKHLKKGKYYNDKVVIIDVPSAGLCMCRADDGRVLENIHQSSLETVVPKEENAYVAVVSGIYCGEIGQILKRHKDKCIAVVQLLSDRDNLLRLNYDEICHYSKKKTSPQIIRLYLFDIS